MRKGSLERKKIIEDIIGNKYKAPIRIQPKQEQKLYIDRRYHIDGINTNIQKKFGKKFNETNNDFVHEARLPFHD